MNATKMLTTIEAAVNREWIKVSDLIPEAPATGQCKCGASDWLLYEFGYGRSTKLEYTDHWHGYSCGYDDFTEEGLFGILICTPCDEAYRFPNIEAYD